MKNTLFLAIAAFFMAASAQAQSTVDSIAAKYQLLPMPDALTIEKAFPVLGNYTLTSADGTTQQITVTMDSSSKGIVWVDGLPEGRIKAYLKQSPATYRVIAQKSSTGKQIPEGTLIFNPESSTLNVALGKEFNAADPASVFAALNAPATDAVAGATEVKVKSKTSAGKSKSKVQFYSAVKAEQTMSSVNGAQQPQQQQQQQEQQPQQQKQ